MNMVNMSIEMKKPNTPVERRQNHMKYSLVRGFRFHDANTPANTMNAESTIITTEIPSTPSARLMLRGANQVHESVKSIGEASPAALSERNSITRYAASTIRAVAPVTATALTCFTLLLKARPPSISSGTITK